MQAGDHRCALYLRSAPTSQTFTGSGNAVLTPSVGTIKPKAKPKTKKFKTKSKFKKRRKGAVRTKAKKSGAHRLRVRRVNGRGK